MGQGDGGHREVRNPWGQIIKPELRHWVYGGGKVLPGLVARRKPEASPLG